jgi:ABC-type dipeptide/oligopeptide/nickel transport system permease subunit
MMNRTNIFRALSFVIGLAMLLASTMVFLGLSFFPETNEIGITGSSLVGAYFMFYAITGAADIFKYFKTHQVK